VRVFIGFDPREAAAYHTCVQSIIENCSRPQDLQFTPITGEQRDGSNTFIYARFLVPSLCGFRGRALFLDGDMIVRGDVCELFDSIDVAYRACCVVKHDYQTKYRVKYLGNKNEDYPRKNWSSVILWHCGYFANAVLTPRFVAEHDGVFLHRFSWLNDGQIGELPREWNRLVLEEPVHPTDKLLHYTIGIPPFGYPDAEWETVHRRANAPC
jgi:hypothetical protein